MGADLKDSLASEIARLEASIDRAAAATERTLAGHPSVAADDGSRRLLADHEELCRQLGALRERVALAQRRDEGHQALRAELATLLSFARTLQADADDWCLVLAEQIEELERRKAAARREQERLAVEREDLARRRDALQLTILETAARMAQPSRGECRRTVPVFSLGEGLTVCSVSVCCPRRGLRIAERWLVTLDRSHDLLVRRE
ncbi:MAG: hypothetical protein JO304_03635 [Solirubrobacterales bacterium]|nr:hypothetical protein [Solirubrobacterales bacterium]